MCDLTRGEVRDAVLRAFPVEDVWGIGPATAAKLAALGVATAAGLRDLSPKQARALGTVTLERTVLELGGLSCLALEKVAPQRKGMAVTRSFGRPVTSLDELREAVAAYATRTGEKLRARTAWSRASSLPFSTPARTATGRATTGSAAPASCR